MAGKIVAHKPEAIAADMAAMQARLAALESENAALKASRGRSPGFVEKPVPVPKNGGEPGLYLAERTLEGGVVLSLYVGVNGKLSFGGGYGSAKPGIWQGEREAFLRYCEGGGLREDLNRPNLIAVWAQAYQRS